GTFRCTFCETEVEEDESAMPKKDARTLVARFNEQIEPIYALLRETEDVNLAYEILEPEPTEIPALKQSKERAAGAGAGAAAGLAAGQHREAWSTKGPSYEDLYTQNVVISMENQEDLSRSASEGKPARERPIWLRESTVQGAYDPDEMKDGGRDLDAFQEREEGRAVLDDNEEVMRALLIHEKKTPSASAVSLAGAAPLTAASDSESETSESEEESPPRAPALAITTYGLEEEEEEEEEFEVVAEDPTLMVAGRPHTYSQVSQRPELVAQMTPEEKEVYIAMGQRMFEDMFE
ncbi:T2EA factor, partial [Bucco capensis]|nr:T2EA factor [Bucco capensis]